MLQQVVQLCPSYLKDSEDMQRCLTNLGHITEDTMIYSVDAVSMYSNIDTDHGLDVLRMWLDLHKNEILALPDCTWTPTSFSLVLEGMDLVMRNNLFCFGDTRWLQLSGTAMGTSPAPPYATIYNSYHEETALLKNPDHNLVLYKRFIDDGFVMQRGGSTHHDNFLRAMNSFGPAGKRLVWESTGPGKSVDFLDLTITILPDGTVKMSTYQKPMNLYLYLMPTSAHPPWIFKGMIYSMLTRYWQQNTLASDYRKMAKLLFERLLARSHSDVSLRRWFMEAANQIDNPKTKPKNTHDPEEQRLFLHVKYHPSTPARRDVRQAFDAFCRAPLQLTENHHGHTVGDVRLTVAYSKCENIRNLVSRSKLQQNNDELNVTHRIGNLEQSRQLIDS